MRRHSILRALAAPIAFSILASAATAQVQWLSARLTGDQEVPPVSTTARGWATVRIDTATNDVRIFAHGTGLTAVAAHLHTAAAGSNGPVAVPLSGGPNTWTGAATVSAAVAQAILAGGTYVNMHTAANPGGQIRGQVVAAAALRFVATLDGQQTAPPTGSSATGTFVGFLHQPDAVLVYEMQVSGLSGNVAHLHRGAPGQSGGVVVPLNGSGTRWCGVSGRIAASDLADLLAGNLYVNVHTSSFPGGEIRGQVVADEGDYRADLDGRQQVPPVNTTASGTACLRLNPDRTLSYRVSTSGLAGVAAHIHLGNVGQNGSVVFALSGGPTLYQGTTPALTSAQITTLRAGGYYVNVHTAANPGGEIRGQLGGVSLPTTFGGGCPQVGAGTPEIGSRNTACPGASLEVTMSGARAGVSAVLLLGTSRETLGGSPLPLGLGLIGGTDCFVLHDASFTAGAAVSDALGCAEVPFPIPFGLNVRGTLYAQWFVIDAQANSLGLATSNGLAFELR
ncbi:MAG: CHRD domain-containing protein [Planctomycetes bacterium]|nr:CHRD domain-containing protein [Planctomycetota bacterium]